MLHHDDGLVVYFHHNGPKRNGKRLNVSCGIVFLFKNGRVNHSRERYYDLHAWDAFLA